MSLSKLFFQSTVDLKNVREYHFCSPSGNRKHFAGIFLYIGSYAVINPNGLPVFVDVWDKVLFNSGTHILNQKRCVSAENGTKANGVTAAILSDFILFNTFILFKFG